MLGAGRRSVPATPLGQRCSTTSRGSTTRDGDTRPSAMSARWRSSAWPAQAKLGVHRTGSRPVQRARPPEFRGQMMGWARSVQTLQDLTREFEPIARSIGHWVHQVESDAAERRDDHPRASTTDPDPDSRAARTALEHHGCSDPRAGNPLMDRRCKKGLADEVRPGLGGLHAGVLEDSVQRVMRPPPPHARPRPALRGRGSCPPAFRRRSCSGP